jgi:hypothetical protein
MHDGAAIVFTVLERKFQVKHPSGNVPGQRVIIGQSRIEVDGAEK